MFPKWTRGRSSLKSADPGRKPGGCSSNVLLHSQYHPCSEPMSQEREMFRKHGISECGWAGHLELLLRALWEKNVPQRKCVPLERRNGCWRQKSDKHFIFKAFSWLVFASRAFFQWTSLVVMVKTCFPNVGIRFIPAWGTKILPSHGATKPHAP